MVQTAQRVVTRIEANPLLAKSYNPNKRKNVAAYARVSTDSEDQINSYKAQIEYYTEAIAKNPNWNFAGIYADEGITGTDTKKRDSFNRLMRDCKNGKVDYILTKSISRFARNTVDSLTWTRKLRGMGIGVYFEEQAIDSLKAENEMLIGLFSVIAQSESENISANVKWGVQQRMKNGTYMTNFNCFGYRKGDNGVPTVVSSEAETINIIFQKYLDGDSPLQIRGYLTENGYLNYSGTSEWDTDTIRYILRNEKYVGDVILQKTYRNNCIDKKAKVNNGELPKYLVSNNHPAIVDRDLFNLVQTEIARRGSLRSKTSKSVTEKGRYCSLYALSDVLICGCCGSHFKRKGKTEKGKRIYYWRCINRMDRGKEYCKDSIGIEERKLHEAICKCLSSMMENRDEVVSLIEKNLQYALTGNSSVLDTYAIENQIKLLQEQAGVLMDRMDSTNGNTEIYEKEIMKQYEKIAVLREQLSTAKAKSDICEDVQNEMQRIISNIKAYNCDSFTSYSDVTVRRLIESVTVLPEGKIAVILKGGFRCEEKLN